MDWFDLLAVQETQESSPTPHFKSINSSVLSFLHSSTLTSIHDHWIKKGVYPLQKKKKNLHKPDNHDGVNAQLEPDTLECEVKWA